MTDELLLLARANPAPATAEPWRDRPLDARALGELAELEEGAAVPRRHRRWLLGAAAAALATVGMVAVNVLLPSATQVAVAATPPLLEFSPTGGSASSALTEIAANAAGSTPSPGQPRSASWQEWSLSTRIDGEQVRSAVIPQDVTLTWAPDGSGSLRAVTGEPFFPSSEHEKAWHDAGEPGAPGTTVRDDTFAPGEFRPVYGTAPPTEAAQMRTYLQAGHPIAELGTAELFVAVQDLARSWKLDGRQRAAVLEVLAAEPDVQLLGTTRDRQGREGTAVAVDSDMSGLPMRYVLVFDPPTGELLAGETQLTSDPGQLDVPTPSVIAYAVWDR